METYFANLEDRRLLTISGSDAEEFLQGLVTNDVQLPLAGQPVFSAFLTPQGKFLHDFFIVAGHETLLLDTEVEGIDELKRRLSMYRLRSDVAISFAPDETAVWAIWGSNAAKVSKEGHTYADPRLEALGLRAIGDQSLSDSFLSSGLVEATSSDYDQWRLAHGVPSGSKDLLREKSALLESNYDVLGAISWDKGCYMGQELTARTRYRGLVKRRLAQITFSGDQLPKGSPVALDGRQVGDVRSTAGGIGIASMRLDALSSADKNQFDVEGTRVTVRIPDYLSDGYNKDNPASVDLSQHD